MTKIIYESFVIMCQIVLKHENTKVSHQILRGLGEENQITLERDNCSSHSLIHGIHQIQRKKNGENSHFNNCIIVKSDKLQEISV